MCLRIHLPVFVNNLHSRHEYLLSLLLFSRMHAVVNHACEHVNILEYTEHVRVYTDLGTRVQQMRGKGYRYNQYSVYGAVVMINVGLTQTCPKQSNGAIVALQIPPNLLLLMPRWAELRRQTVLMCVCCVCNSVPPISRRVLKTKR